MAAEEEESVVAEEPSGRMIIKYLQQNKEGATMSNILLHLSSKCEKEPKVLSSTVLSLLENGTALGFLERKGSRYMNWFARENACGRRRRRRRRSCSRRRRRRRICRRKRRCCCRKRRRRA